MQSSAPIVLAFVGLVLAAFWYDAMVAPAGGTTAAATAPKH